MKRIGLTGTIGTGKSTVAWMFAERGVATLDADTLAHQVMTPHTPSWKKIFERYGKTILIADGVIDREKLARIVFQNPQERAWLESLIHPPVKEAIERELAKWKHAGRSYGVVEVQLLFEAKWEAAFDLIVVVTCNQDVQLTRCQKKFDWSREEVVVRLQSQWPLEKKIAKADIVIENTGTLDETRVQVDRLWHAWERGDFSAFTKEVHS